MSFYSQLEQDKWVLSIIGDKTDGYFIELGACDGLYYSNTLYFEKKGWNGICIEPNDLFFEKLKYNRMCHVSNDLVSSEENKIVEFILNDAVSSINDRTIGPFTLKNDYKVVNKYTTTLEKVLDKYNAPNIIDYLSLDVEGHEYEVIKNFNFDKYIFRCITVEHNEPHNGDELRKKIRLLLEEKGYKFVKGNDDVHNWNHGPIDDFYVYNFK